MNGVAVRQYSSQHIWVASAVGTTVNWTDYGLGTQGPGVDFAQQGDFNGDGKADILSFILQTGHFAVALNSGASSFLAAADWSPTYSPNLGMPDNTDATGRTNSGFLVGNFANHVTDPLPAVRDDVAWFEQTGNSLSIRVTVSDGTQFIEYAITSPILGTPDNVRIFDVNADGLKDIFYHAVVNNESRYYIYTNNGSGGFALAATTRDFNGGGAPSSPTYEGTWDDVRVGEFDGTPGDEIAVRYFTGRGLTMSGAKTNYGDWWTWDGSWSVGYIARWIESQPVGFSYTENVWQNIRVADFDSDGVSDILGRNAFGSVMISQSSLGYTNVTIGTVTLGVGSTTKKSDNGYGIGAGAGVFVGDLDGDLKPDILWLNIGSTSVVYTNNVSVGPGTAVSFNTTPQAIPAPLELVWFNGGSRKYVSEGFGNW